MITNSTQFFQKAILLGVPKRRARNICIEVLITGCEHFLPEQDSTESFLKERIEPNLRFIPNPLETEIIVASYELLTHTKAIETFAAIRKNEIENGDTSAEDWGYKFYHQAVRVFLKEEVEDNTFP